MFSDMPFMYGVIAVVVEIVVSQLLLQQQKLETPWLCRVTVFSVYIYIKIRR